MTPTERMYEALKESKIQIEYLHGKFNETGTGNKVLHDVQLAITSYESSQAEEAKSTLLGHELRLGYWVRMTDSTILDILQENNITRHKKFHVIKNLPVHNKIK